MLYEHSDEATRALKEVYIIANPQVGKDVLFRLPMHCTKLVETCM